MKIEKTVIEIWNKRIGSLPKDIVSNEIGISKPTLYSALKGRCNYNTMNLINVWLIQNKDRELTKLDKL